MNKQAILDEVLKKSFDVEAGNPFDRGTVIRVHDLERILSAQPEESNGLYEVDNPEECCPYCGMLEIACECDQGGE